MMAAYILFKDKIRFFNNYTIHILLYNLRPEGKDYVLPNTNSMDIIYVRI